MLMLMSNPRGLPNVASLGWFMLLWKVANALSLTAQIAATTSTDESEEQYQSNFNANNFVDCSSFSSRYPSLTAAASASTTTATGNNTGPFRTTNSTRAANYTSVPFEEYWCAVVDESPANTPDSFPNNGSVVPHLYGLNASVKDYCLSLEKANYSSWAVTASPTILSDIYDMSSQWQPTLTQPCCDTFCNIAAATAQLLYWPTPAPFPNVSTVVGTDGFTFTSPSVYVVYSGVSAYGLCGNIGPTYDQLTKSYPPSEISTFPNGDFGQGASLNYADLFSNCTATVLDTSIGAGEPPCETQGLSIETGVACSSQMAVAYSSYSYNQIHCYPELSFPPGLQSVDPSWASCDSDPYGGHFAFVFDPPRALKPRTALVPSPTAVPDTQPSAAPVPHPSTPGPAKTPPPSAAPEVVPANNGDPNNSNDPSNGNPSGGNGPGSGNNPSSGSNPSSGNSPSNGNPSNGNTNSGGENSGNSDPGAGNPGSGGSTGNDSPADPSNETPAQLSALHQALDPASSANSQPVPAVQPNGGEQPAADPNANTPAPANSPADNEGSSGAGGNTPSSGNSNSGGNDPNQSSPGAVIGGASPAATTSFNIPIPGGQELPSIVNNEGSVVIAGSTIQAGASAVQVANHQISIDPQASNVVVDGQSHALPSPNLQPPMAPTSVFTVDNQAITLSSDNIIAAGSTFKANGPAFTIAGTVVSLDSSVLHIGTSNIALALQAPSTAASRIITAAGQSATVLSNGVAIAGTTLTPNAPAITVSGTAVSLGPSGLVIGTSTIPLPTATVLTAAGEIVTVLSDGAVIDGTTLSPNAPGVTIAGTLVSLGSSGLVVGTSTIPIQAALSSAAGGIGGFVFSGINGGVTTGNANGSQAISFQGGGSRVRISWSVLGTIVVATMMAVWLESTV